MESFFCCWYEGKLECHVAQGLFVLLARGQSVLRVSNLKLIFFDPT